LDGIPLALQLAAVLPGSPSLDQLNQRLGLTHGWRTTIAISEFASAKLVWPPTGNTRESAEMVVLFGVGGSTSVAGGR
jgi:hypothetical protein